jgi:outer membrane protein TolC
VIAMVTALIAAAAPATGLTEDQAVALALQNSPELRWHAHRADEAAALSEAALAWNNPLLRVGGVRYDRAVEPALTGRPYDDHPFDHTTIGLRWSPPGLGERSARRADGSAREAEAHSALVLSRRDTIALVRGLHAQVTSDDAEIMLLAEVVEQRGQMLALVKRRIELQSATLLDQNLTEVDYLDAATQLAELAVRRRASYEELLIQTGLPAGTTISLVPSANACAEPVETALLAEQARRANPGLHVMQAQREAATAARHQRVLQLLPWFDYVQVAYGLAGQDHPAYLAFQLQLTLPLLDWKGPHRRALQAREQALSERLQVENRVLSERVVRAAAAQAEQAALLRRYREAASVVERATAGLRKTLSLSGPTNLFEIVELETRLLATRRAALRAELDCKLQQIEIDRLTGRGVEELN